MSQYNILQYCPNTKDLLSGLVGASACKITQSELLTLITGSSTLTTTGSNVAVSDFTVPVLGYTFDLLYMCGSNTAVGTVVSNANLYSKVGGTSNNNILICPTIYTGTGSEPGIYPTGNYIVTKLSYASIGSSPSEYIAFPRITSSNSTNTIMSIQSSDYIKISLNRDYIILWEKEMNGDVETLAARFLFEYSGGSTTSAPRSTVKIEYDDGIVDYNYEFYRKTVNKNEYTSFTDTTPIEMAPTTGGIPIVNYDAMLQARVNYNSLKNIATNNLVCGHKTSPRVNYSGVFPYGTTRKLYGITAPVLPDNLKSQAIAGDNSIPSVCGSYTQQTLRILLPIGVSSTYEENAEGLLYFIDATSETSTERYALGTGTDTYIYSNYPYETSTVIANRMILYKKYNYVINIPNSPSGSAIVYQYDYSGNYMSKTSYNNLISNGRFFANYYDIIAALDSFVGTTPGPKHASTSSNSMPSVAITNSYTVYYHFAPSTTYNMIPSSIANANLSTPEALLWHNICSVSHINWSNVGLMPGSTPGGDVIMLYPGYTTSRLNGVSWSTTTTANSSIRYGPNSYYVYNIKSCGSNLTATLTIPRRTSSNVWTTTGLPSGETLPEGVEINLYYNYIIEVQQRSIGDGVIANIYQYEPCTTASSNPGGFIGIQTVTF